MHLFLFGIARQFDHFQAVTQRGGNGVQHIGRRQEDNLREIVGNFQVVIRKGVILFGVKHL